MTLTPTPGAANADTYATLAEAAAYIATLTFAGDWPADDAAREKVLRQAALLMETLTYKGTRAQSAELQALAFPRIGLTDADGYLIASTVVPVQVKRAQVELALRLASEDRTADAGALVPDALKVGALELGSMRHKTFPDQVLAMLRPFLASDGISVKLVRTS